MVFRVPPDGDGRAAYLGELAGLIWPAPAEPSLRRGGAGWVVVPSAARPRLLVPTGSGRAAASAVRHSTEAVGRKAKLVRQGLATAFRLGLGPLVFRDRLVVDGGGLDAHLAEVLGEPALVSLHIGPARANRKPVLQLLAPDGRALGYAKLGVDPLTRALVHAEADALRRLAEVPLGPVVLAGVRHHGDWHGHALLVQEALPVRLPRAAPAPAGGRTRGHGGGRRLSRRTPGVVGGQRARGPAHRRGGRARNPAGGRAAARGAEVRRGRRPGGRLRRVARGLERRQQRGARRRPGAGLGLGRFEADVPAGYDALHLAVQGAMSHDGVEPVEAARALIAGAGATLAPFDQTGGGADLVAVLYLVELAARYLRDRQAEAGARLGHVDTWLLPAVEEHLARRAR
ncbi:translation initiation factor IF-2 [Micromonospora sp. M42]|uniref:hypothetical protein n=1 Tax=Micromonospora sp. M42 TaxID=457406 RepID=UPI0003EECF22|nr:hypothetical protein [Micromonospora sp. M42]EWM66921.1 translation initiation factor IF-2 [Micromonospora sp. M42]